jgi:hypothetical protein
MNYVPSRLVLPQEKGDSWPYILTSNRSNQPIIFRTNILGHFNTSFILYKHTMSRDRYRASTLSPQDSFKCGTLRADRDTAPYMPTAVDRHVRV